MKKKLLKLIIVMTISITALFALGMTASAVVTDGGLTLTLTADGAEPMETDDYTYANGVLTINSSVEMTISGSTEDDRIFVAAGVDANITFAGLNIDGKTNGYCAFEIADSSTGDVTITIADGTTNTLQSGEGAGIQKNGGVDTGTLTITGGTGILNVYGGRIGAGIGSTAWNAASNITINGGVIYAQGGEGVLNSTGSEYIDGSGAGIGSGQSGIATNIVISGGVVSATGGRGAAGIGGGESGNATDVVISGGTVTAKFGKFYDYHSSGDIIECNGGGTIGSGAKGAASSASIIGGFVTLISAGYGPNYINVGTADLSGAQNAIVLDKEWYGGACSGAIYGSPVITDDCTIPSECELVIQNGSTLTIQNGVTLTNDGKIINRGRIDNSGTIINNGRLSDLGKIDSSGTLINNGIINNIETGDLLLNASDGVTTLTEDDFDYSNNTLTIKSDTPVTISGSTENDKIFVAAGVDANITFAGLDINGKTNGYFAFCAFEIADSSTGDVTITIADGTTNTLQSGEGAGIQKNGGVDTGTLTITGGTGILNVYGGRIGAGIGSTGYNAASNITINGGVIYAQGGEGVLNSTGSEYIDGSGAGIGSGQSGIATNIVISGGVVSATGGRGAAGIGGGERGNATDVVISGGTVTAKFGEFYDYHSFGDIIQCNGGGTIGSGAMGAESSASIIGGFVTLISAGDGPNYINVGTADLSDVQNAIVLDEIMYEGIYSGTIYGSPVITDDCTIPSEYELIIQNGSTLTIQNGVTLTNNGKIINHGNIINNGTITGTGTISGNMFSVSGGTEYTDYVYIDSTLVVKSETTLTIANTDPLTPTTHRIEVENGVSANIILAGVNIEVWASEEKAAFSIADNSTGNVTVTIADGTTNILISGPECAGLQKNGNADGIGELTIQGGDEGTGTLISIGGDCGAGIGGGLNETGTNININGGTVIATGGDLGAGVGGGCNGIGSNITINGGVVTVKGGYLGAGIGGGSNGTGSDIEINGGSVKVSADNDINTFGGGFNEDAVPPVDENDNNVYLFEVENTNGADVVINNNDYPDKHLEETIVYAYLPAKTADEPNKVTVGTEMTEYCYDTANSKWLIVVDAPVEDKTNFTYKGEEQTYTLAESEYYTISDNTTQTNAGTYTVTVALNENCVWSDGETADKEYTFTIAKAELTVTAESYTVKLGNPLPETLEYTVSGLEGADTEAVLDSANLSFGYENGITPSAIAAYNIIASGEAEIKNYVITYVNGTLIITAKDIQTITASDVTLTYGDTDGKITATTDGDGAISYKVTTGDDVISVDENGNITVLKFGTATVTITAEDTFDYAEATKTVTVTVNKKKISLPTVDGIEYTYTGTAQTYGVTSTDDYTVEGGTQTNAGEYPVTITLNNDNYEWDGTLGTYKFVINKAAVTVTAKSYTIKVGEALPSYAYDVTGLVNGETLPIDVTIFCTADGKTAGTFDIVVSGDTASDNYTFAYVDGTLTVTTKNVQTITASDVTLTYGDTDGRITATANGSISYDVATGADVISVDENGNITILKFGTATVTITAEDTFDYAEATKTISVTVNKKKIAVPADTTEYTYTGTAQTYGVVSTADYTVEGGVQTNAGEYPVTITLNNENYEWDGTLGTYTFVIKQVPVTVTAKSYTIKVGDTLPTYAYDVAGLVNGEALPIDVTISCTADGKTAGTFDIVVSGDTESKNYKFSYVNGTLTVSEKEVVAAPTFTPASGTVFSSSLKITIACATEGAKIYYTTDGTAPTTASTLYNGAITVTATTTVKAIAVKDGMTNSIAVTAVYTRKSSGSSGGGGYTPSRPSTPTNPEINGKSAGWTTIASDIENLTAGGETTIELNGNYDVPVDVMKAIADKDIKVTFVVDSTRSWIIDGAEIRIPAAVDLSILTVASLNTGTLRGDVGTRFRIDGTNAPTELCVTMNKKHAGKFANLYMKKENELVFVDNVKVDENGKAVLSVSEKGDYVIMLCEYSDRKGDVSNDGVTNAMDASAILKDIVELEDAANPEILDYNGDGKVNALDASSILIDIVNDRI